MDPKNIAGDRIDETSLLAATPASPIAEGALALDTDAAETDEKGVTREQRRSRRKRDVRARTISVKRMTKRELEMGRMLYPDVEDIARPKLREDCGQGERPCPFVSCSTTSTSTCRRAPAPSS
jgi:hypothetical protein